MKKADEAIPNTKLKQERVERNWTQGQAAEKIGKPEPGLFHEAMHLLGSQPDETVMIGDVLAVDIKGGQVAGVHTLLVLSGNTSRTELERSSIKPEYVYQDIAELLRQEA